MHSLPGGISHTTARTMLAPQPLQSGEAEAFIGCQTGLGLFVTQAGPNRVCMHQAANDGFRGIFLACYQGPNAGQGLVVLSNGDRNAVPFNARVSQARLF